MLTWVFSSLLLYFAVRWVRTTIERGARRRGLVPRSREELRASKAPKTREVPSPPASSPTKKVRQKLAHEVLGVDEDAPVEVIQAQYRKLAIEYHPDRVASSATELQELAGKRLREINMAYSALMKARGGRG